MIEPYPIEGVFQCNHALNLMGHDHGFEHHADSQRRIAIGQAFLRQVIGHRENTAEVIGRMPPFSGEPGVVVVEPADDAADVPCRFDGIEPQTCSGNPGAERNDGAFHDGAQVFGAFGEAQGQQAAAEGVHQAVAGSVQRFLGLDFEVEDVIGNVLQDGVVVGAVVQVDVGAHVRFTLEVVR